MLYRTINALFEKLKCNLWSICLTSQNTWLQFSSKNMQNMPDLVHILCSISFIKTCSSELLGLTWMEPWRFITMTKTSYSRHTVWAISARAVDISLLWFAQNNEFHPLNKLYHYTSLSLEMYLNFRHDTTLSFYSPFVYCNILSTRTGYLVIRWVTSRMHSGIPRRRANKLLFLSCTDTNTCYQ